MLRHIKNFASHHTRDCHIGFLSLLSHCAVLENTMSQIFLFSSYHNTKLQLKLHTRLKFHFRPQNKSKVQAFFVFFLYTTLLNVKDEGYSS